MTDHDDDIFEIRYGENRYHVRVVALMDESDDGDIGEIVGARDTLGEAEALGARYRAPGLRIDIWLAEITYEIWVRADDDDQSGPDGFAILAGEDTLEEAIYEVESFFAPGGFRGNPKVDVTWESCGPVWWTAGIRVA